MSVFLPIPKFIENSPDNMHCGPACWRMILETYTPETLWSFEEIDQIMSVEPGKYTWGETFYPTVLDQGYRIHNISTWDYRAFMARTWDYMRERSGDTFTNDQIKYAPNMEYVMDCYHKIANHPSLTHDIRPATLLDIEHHLNAGAYIKILVNGRGIRELDGVSSHSVVIYGIDDQFVYIQNPGLPPFPEQIVPIDIFLKVWNFGKVSNYALSAIYSKDEL